MNCKIVAFKYPIDSKHWLILDKNSTVEQHNSYVDLVLKDLKIFEFPVNGSFCQGTQNY